MVNHDLWHDVQQFLFHEAWLLDEHKFDEWLELFTDDTFYWMPGRINQMTTDMADSISKYGELALFEETKQTLQMRVARLHTGMAWAEQPPSRTRHLVTNVLVEAGAKPDEYKVQCCFLIYRTQLEHELDIWVGKRDDLLRKSGNSFKIASRTIILDQAVLEAKNLSVFF